MTNESILATGFARALLHLVPLKFRGRRECRVFVAPAALRATKKARKQVTTGTPKQSGIPCAIGVNGYSALSPVLRACWPP